MKPTRNPRDGTVYPPLSKPTPEQIRHEKILRFDREVAQPTLLTLGKMVVPAPTRAELATASETNGGNGFIRFYRSEDLLRVGQDKGKLALLPTVCFSSRIYTGSAVEIIGDTMPDRWWPGLEWADLNILKEGYWNSHHHTNPGPCMKSLNNFIRAFEFKDGDRLFMHVFNAYYLPK